MVRLLLLFFSILFSFPVFAMQGGSLKKQDGVQAVEFGCPSNCGDAMQLRKRKTKQVTFNINVHHHQHFYLLQAQAFVQGNKEDEQSRASISTNITAGSEPIGDNRPPIDGFWDYWEVQDCMACLKAPFILAKTMFAQSSSQKEE